MNATEHAILLWAADQVRPGCLESDAPSAADLCAWLPECPGDALDKAGAALDTMTGAHGWTWRPYRVTAGAVVISRLDDSPVMDPTIAAWRVDGSAVFSLDLTRAHAVETGYAASCEPGESAPEHPAITFTRAWLERPRAVEPERRRDRRILPRIEVSESRPERTAGMLFGGLHEGRRIEAPELPLFPEVSPAKRVPILDLVDMAGVPVMSRGRGAPLPMRLFVRALASVRPAHRNLATVRLALTLRELRDGLFPHGWRIGQHWPVLRDALLHAGTTRSTTAAADGGRWRCAPCRTVPDLPT